MSTSNEPTEEIIVTSLYKVPGFFTGVAKDDTGKAWYQNGLFHRDENSPALIRKDGTQFWYSWGTMTKVQYPSNNPQPSPSTKDEPIIENSLKFPEIPFPPKFHGSIQDANGDSFHYVNGKLHNLNGPAVNLPGKEHRYYVHGKLHRLDGPAIDVFGKESVELQKEWWINGIQYSKQDYLEQIKMLEFAKKFIEMSPSFKEVEK